MARIIISNLRFQYILIFILTLFFTANRCCNSFAQYNPSDHHATNETQNLYSNLGKIAKQGVMFGHQDDLASGVFWKELDGRSDIKDVVGEYPAVFGWDLGLYEMDKSRNFDHISISKIKDYIIQVHRRGGINTISWHSNNPVNREESVRDTSNSFQTISKLFADNLNLNIYKTWLDKVASFMLSLKDSNGTLIPVIFRPFHENTGNWFWWGKSHSTPEEYVNIWRFTVNYLRQEKKVHNILYAYSTGQFTTKDQYIERYPGDSYVDILGFDAYDRAEENQKSKFSTNVSFMIQTIKQLGIEKRKVTAFTETGLKLTPDPKWWTNTLLPLIRDSGLSYVLLWRNGGINSYWSTYPDQISAENFQRFHKDKKILFGNYIENKKIFIK